MMKVVIALAALVAVSLAQRSPYAGSAPIGYPEVTTTEADELSNRFGGTTTTIRLPIEALGDAALYKRLLKLPPDQQPFWLLNWLELERNRNNPQSYPARGSQFSDSLNQPQST